MNVCKFRCPAKSKSDNNAERDYDGSPRVLVPIAIYSPNHKKIAVQFLWILPPFPSFVVIATTPGYENIKIWKPDVEQSLRIHRFRLKIFNSSEKNCEKDLTRYNARFPNNQFQYKGSCRYTKWISKELLSPKEKKYQITLMAIYFGHVN